MELRHLRYFVAVAEERHVTRAAERLGLQQPPLSQQIRALERELDVQLFRRRPRGVELTDAGAVLLGEALAILSHIDHASAAARRTARGEQGRIAVGFTSSVPFHPFVPRVIRAYREAFPLVALTLEEGGTIDLVEGLRKETIDVAFVRTGVADQQELVVTPLLKEAMVLALPRTHILARRNRKAVSLNALGEETFIIYRRQNGPGLHDAILSAWRAQHPDHHRYVLITRYNRTSVLHDMGRHDEALAELETILALERAQHDDQHRYVLSTRHYRLAHRAMHDGRSSNGRCSAG